jgi:hypothetical protein
MRVRDVGLGIVALLAGAAALLVSVCADGGDMGARYRTCACLGVEWELYDARPADGPHRTVCIGLVRSRTCYRMTDGPVVECSRSMEGGPTPTEWPT